MSLRLSIARYRLSDAGVLLANAGVSLTALFAGRVFPPGWRTAQRGRAVMRRRHRAMVRCRNGAADQLLDVAQKR